MEASFVHSEAVSPPRARLFTTWICRVLGGLLLLAAGLKVHGMGVEPVASTGAFSAPAFKFLVVVFEILLGVWLLSGKYQLAAWLTVLVSFVGFTGVSFYQGWIGQASCGCFAKVTVNPWITFGIDLVAVTALLLARPDLTPLLHHRSRIAFTIAGFLASNLLLLGFLATYAHYRHGSVADVLATFRNERLSVNPAMIDMGEGSPGETRTAAVELTNRTDQPIRLIGGTSDCSCTVLDDLPVTIPPGEAHSISITMRLPNAPGSFNRKAQLSIDDQGFTRVGFRLTGRIIPAPE